MLQYIERVREMHDLAKYITPPLMKGREYDEEYCNVCDKELSENTICVATRYELITSMKD